MTEKIRETLSALMDGEATEIEVHRLLREIDQNPGLRRSWIAYQQIRSTIRKEPYVSRTSHHDLATRLRSSIEAETPYSDGSAHSGSGRSRAIAPGRFIKPAAGLAVAASLVGAIFLTFQATRVTDGGAPEAGLVTRDTETTAPASTSSLPALRSGPTTFVSNPPQADPDATLAAGGAAPEAVDPGESELRELDEERLREVRAYLMRHDRVARMNPGTRVVTNRSNPGD